MNSSSIDVALRHPLDDILVAVEPIEYLQIVTKWILEAFLCIWGVDNQRAHFVTIWSSTVVVIVHFPCRTPFIEGVRNYQSCTVARGYLVTL